MKILETRGKQQKAQAGRGKRLHNLHVWKRHRAAFKCVGSSILMTHFLNVEAGMLRLQGTHLPVTVHVQNN